MINLQEMTGYIGGILVLLSCLLYMWSIVKGKTVSNKVTWGVWTLVTALTLFTYYGTNGLASSIWTLVAYLIGTLCIFVLLLLYAQGGQWTWLERFVIVGVVATVVAWVLFRSSELAMTLVLIVDILGSLLVVKYAFKSPSGEYGPAWYLAFIGNLVNLIAIAKWDYNNAVYPLYLTVLTVTVSILVAFPTLFRRKIQ